MTTSTNGHDPRHAELLVRHAQAFARGDYPRAFEAMRELAAQGTTQPSVVLSTAEIFAPLPPIPWVCEAIELAPGAPTLLAGYGFAGKTLLAQDLAIAVAARDNLQCAWDGVLIREYYASLKKPSKDGSLWPDREELVASMLAKGLPVRHGRVVHLDYEQGAYLTRRRYQRLALARGLGPDDLDLQLVVRPNIYLDDRAAEDWLVRVLDGAVLAIVDPLRAAAPGIEENSSASRKPLDLLARVSERTGCAPFLLHHARKPQTDAPGGARMAIRGSSALYDACQSVLVAEGEVGKPTVLTHEKAKLTGQCADAMHVTFDDIDTGTFEQMTGLVVTIETVPGATANKRVAALVPHVVDFVGAHPGCTSRRLRAELATGCRPTLVDLAVSGVG